MCLYACLSSDRGQNDRKLHMQSGWKSLMIRLLIGRSSTQSLPEWPLAWLGRMNPVMPNAVTLESPRPALVQSVNSWMPKVDGCCRFRNVDQPGMANNVTIYLFGAGGSGRSPSIVEIRALRILGHARE
jgi:hypothetical protein